MHGVGSRNKLTRSHARLYPGDGTLDVLGRAVCAAERLPRKELHEAWEMAARITPLTITSGCTRVVDLCCGFGVLAQVLLLVDDCLAHASAVCVDVDLPANHGRVHQALAAAFPALTDRVAFVQSPLARVPIYARDLVVSAHACGSLSDDVMARAVDAGAHVAVLPCCHEFRYRADLVDVADPAGAIDDERRERLTQLGYRVSIASIPAEVSPKNRVLLGSPR
ncbi:MAG TPA: methyltransferase [Myxococcota bacterium]|jgi:hypothetical protein